MLGLYGGIGSGLLDFGDLDGWLSEVAMADPPLDLALIVGVLDLVVFLALLDIATHISPVPALGAYHYRHPSTALFYEFITFKYYGFYERIGGK